jgi:hypothetical protein
MCLSIEQVDRMSTALSSNHWESVLPSAETGICCELATMKRLRFPEKHLSYVELEFCRIVGLENSAAYLRICPQPSKAIVMWLTAKAATQASASI